MRFKEVSTSFWFNKYLIFSFVPGIFIWVRNLQFFKLKIDIKKTTAPGRGFSFAFNEKKLSLNEPFLNISKYLLAIFQ